MFNGLIRCSRAQRALILAAAMTVCFASIMTVAIINTSEDLEDSAITHTLFLDAKAIADFKIETVESDWDSQSNSVLIPREALLCLSGEHFVFVKDFVIPHAFFRVPVTITAEHQVRVEVADGLFPGDEVVISGVELLNSKQGQVLSNDVLKQILDAPVHASEHPDLLTQLLRSTRRFIGGAMNKKHFHETL